METSKLLVIVGETASGKSALALQLAQRFNSEIICADSRTVYTGMDIGTAKPSVSDRAIVPHHGLDLVTPGQVFTVSDFKAYAERTISEVQKRGKLPILVGGSGLYIDAYLYNYQFRELPDPILRQELSVMTVEHLQQRVIDMKLPLPSDPLNPRRLIRTIETGGQSVLVGSLRNNTLMLGVSIDRDVLFERINQRMDAMFRAGLEQEVRQLADQFGWDVQAMQSPGYKEFRTFDSKQLTLADKQIIDKQIAQHTRNLAKRQRTWFKRNKSIHWLTTEDKLAEAVDYATTFVNT